MPNTLVHIALQTLGSRALLKQPDFRWIAAGCVIPDVPWIIQRLILKFNTGTDPYSLLNYATVQSSLFFCLLLSGAIALTANTSARIFLLLGFNSLLHLILDALEIKWANGVHLFAPFSWKPVTFALIWPEHPLSYALSLAGFALLIYYATKEWRTVIALTTAPAKLWGAALLLTLYLALPMLLTSGPGKADNHYAATLQKAAARPGKEIELDRSRYRSSDNTIRIFSGERFKVEGHKPEQDGLVSVRGYFIDKNTIHISTLHVHNSFRDRATLVALAGVAFIWGLALCSRRLVPVPSDKTPTLA